MNGSRLQCQHVRLRRSRIVRLAQCASRDRDTSAPMHWHCGTPGTHRATRPSCCASTGPRCPFARRIGIRMLCRCRILRCRVAVPCSADCRSGRPLPSRIPFVCPHYGSGAGCGMHASGLLAASQMPRFVSDDPSATDPPESPGKIRRTRRPAYRTFRRGPWPQWQVNQDRSPWIEGIRGIAARSKRLRSRFLTDGHRRIHFDVEKQTDGRPGGTRRCVGIPRGHRSHGCRRSAYRARLWGKDQSCRQRRSRRMNDRGRNSNDCGQFQRRYRLRSHTSRICDFIFRFHPRRPRFC